MTLLLTIHLMCTPTIAISEPITNGVMDSGSLIQSGITAMQVKQALGEEMNGTLIVSFSEQDWLNGSQVLDLSGLPKEDNRVECWVYRDTQTAMPLELLDSEEREKLKSAQEFVGDLFVISAYKRVSLYPNFEYAFMIERSVAKEITGQLVLPIRWYGLKGMNAVIVKTDNAWWPTEATLELNVRDWIQGSTVDIYCLNSNTSRLTLGSLRTDMQKFLAGGLQVQNGKVKIPVSSKTYTSLVVIGQPVKRQPDVLNS